MKKKYQEEQMPKFLGMLEKLLVSNKGGDGYFIGDKVNATELLGFPYFVYECYHRRAMTLTIIHLRQDTPAEMLFKKVLALYSVCLKVAINSDYFINSCIRLNAF